MPLVDASRLWRIFSLSGGFLRNENRTIIIWDMGKNVKIDPDRARKNKGVPLLGEVPLLENLRYKNDFLKNDTKHLGTQQYGVPYPKR